MTPLLHPGWNAGLTSIARDHEYARGKCPDGLFTWQRGMPYFGGMAHYPDIEMILSRVTLSAVRQPAVRESVTCVICGKPLAGKRRHSVTCGAACRKALSRRASVNRVV